MIFDLHFIANKTAYIDSNYAEWRMPAGETHRKHFVIHSKLE